MASTTSDLTLLGRKLGALDYNPELYVKEIARRSVGGHELLQQRNNIKTLSESTHSQLKKNVYQNYRQFIDTAKEISFLESEMYQLSHMITDQRNLLSELMQFSVSGEKVDPIDVESIKESPESSNSTGAAAGSSANKEKAEVIKKGQQQSDFQEGRKKLLELLDKVEGCSHVLDVPTRYLMHNADMVEMDVTENTALHRVHGYLTNDGFMVATWLPNRRGPVRYKYSCFYELDSLAVVNVRDLGGIKHTFKLLVFPEPRLFQCANAEAKKAWMDAFERAKSDSKKVDVLSGTSSSSEAAASARASYRAKSARQKPPRKANGSTLSTHGDSNNPFFDDKIEDQSLHELEGENGGHESKPREDIVLPEWLLELPEDLEVYIAQREFVQAVDLVLKATEFCHNTMAAATSNKGEASLVLQEAWQSLEARIEHLIQVLSRELSTEKSFQGGPRAARNAVQLLCRLGRSAQAVELFLQHREAILQASLRSSKIESATGTYVQRQSVTFFAGVLESSVEFRKAFCQQQQASELLKIEEIEATKMSSLLVWIRGQMIRFLERIDKQIFSPSTPLETISICVESLRSQANNTLRHSGIDLLFLVDAHLRRNVERTICEHRDKHVDAVKLRAQEDKWEPINCFNKAGTERFLEEMATAGLPSVRSYVQDQCFVVLTRNTTSFSLSYLNLADSLLRLYCPSMRALVNESLVTVFHAHLRHIDQALRSERLKTVDPKFVQRNAAFLLDTLLSLVEHKYHQKTGSDCPKLGKLHSSYSWLKDGSRIPSASSSAASTSVTTTKYTDPSYV